MKAKTVKTIKKDMKFWRLFRELRGNPGRGGIQEHIQIYLVKTTKKEDNLKEVYLKKANSLLRRKSDFVWRISAEQNAQREPKGAKREPEGRQREPKANQRKPF